MDFDEIFDIATRVRRNIQEVIVGKGEVVNLLLVALLGGGHVLLEDVPGTGKTLIAKALARSIDVSFRRIQFTPDLLPSDVSGVHFFNQKENEFEFRAGPVFTNILLADELNRATPRTQSSLLEAMEERQVTQDGETRALARPFMVIATQNPIENQGTYPLPEAQLDRFMLRVHMDYPGHDEGVEILRRFQRENPLSKLGSVADGAELAAASDEIGHVRIDDEVLDYLLRIVEATRKQDDILLGISPRGSQALLRAAQVLAVLRHRDFVTPDDVKTLTEPVLAHRLIVRQRSLGHRDVRSEVLAAVVNNQPVPTEELR